MNDKNIYQRLSAIMKDVSYIQKEDKRVNNQYTFVSHDAVTAKIRPAMVEHGVMPVVSVREFKQDGNRTEVNLTVQFVNIDKPSELVEINAFGFGIDPQDKGPGKAISYAFKYAILKMFCLETGDDPEKDNINHTPAPPLDVPKGYPQPGDGFTKDGYIFPEIAGSIAMKHIDDVSTEKLKLCVETIEEKYSGKVIPNKTKEVRDVALKEILKRESFTDFKD